MSGIKIDRHNGKLRVYGASVGYVSEETALEMAIQFALMLEATKRKVERMRLRDWKRRVKRRYVRTDLSGGWADPIYWYREEPPFWFEDSHADVMAHLRERPRLP